MALALEYGNTFRSTPEIRSETRKADVILATNGTFETLRDKEVTTNYDGGSLTLLEIDGMKYPIYRKKGDKLFYTRPKYTTQEAFAEPIILGYAGFSTFYNIQIMFDIDQLVTVSNLWLILVIMGLTFWIGKIRQSMHVDVLFLQQYLRGYKTIDIDKLPHNPMTLMYSVSKGFSFPELLMATAIGMLLVLPIALSDIVYEIEYGVSWIAGVILLLVLSGKLFEDKEVKKLKYAQPRVHAPAVVEPIFSNGNPEKISEIKGYQHLGLLINIKGESKKDRQKFIAETKKKYKDKILVGINEVYEFQNALDTIEQPFQTILAEAYSDSDLDKEPEFEVLSSDDAKKVLRDTVPELAKMENIKDALENLPEDDYLHKSVKEIILGQDRLIREYQNATAYLVQENKTRTEITLADKEMIKNVTAAYHAQAANNSRPPELKPEKNMEGIGKIAALGGVMLVFLFALVWMTEQGLI